MDNDLNPIPQEHIDAIDRRLAMNHEERKERDRIEYEQDFIKTALQGDTEWMDNILDDETYIKVLKNVWEVWRRADISLHKDGIVMDKLSHDLIDRAFRVALHEATDLAAGEYVANWDIPSREDYDPMEARGNV